MEGRPARRSSIKSGSQTKEEANKKEPADINSKIEEISHSNNNGNSNNGPVSGSPVPEVPVIIEQFESNRNIIAYKISDADPNASTEATIIQVPKVSVEEKADNDLLVKENGDEVEMKKNLEVIDNIQKPLEEDEEEPEESKEKEVEDESLIDNNVNEKEAQLSEMNENKESFPVSEPSIDDTLEEQSKALPITVGTPKQKRVKRRGDDLSIDFTPVKKDDPMDEKEEDTDTPGGSARRSRYGRVQKTKTPNPEMVSFDTKRRSSKGNISTNDVNALDEVVDKPNENKMEVTSEEEKPKEASEIGMKTPRRKVASSPVKESRGKRKSSKTVNSEVEVMSHDENDVNTKTPIADSSTSLEQISVTKKKQTVTDYVPQKKYIELEMEPHRQPIFIDQDFLTSIPPKEGEFQVGDLVWAKEHTYPWWPCMVSIDPVEKIYSKLSGSSYKSDRVYHIQYFGSQPYRGWTHVGMIMPFEGERKYFDKIVALKMASPKSQASKITAKFAVKPSLKKDWEISVGEAEQALNLDLETRVKALTFIYTYKQSSKRKSTNVTVNASETKKRKVSSSSPEDVYDFDLNAEDEFGRESQATPVLTWKRRNNPTGEFSVYCKKELTKFKTENKGMDENELQDVMRKKWDLLSEDLRSKYADRQFATDSQNMDIITTTPLKIESVNKQEKKIPKSSPRKRNVKEKTKVIVEEDVEMEELEEKEEKKEEKIVEQIEKESKQDIDDEDDDGQLVINEILPQKKSIKKSAKAKKSPIEEKKLESMPDEISVPETLPSSTITPKRPKKDVPQKTPRSSKKTPAKSSEVSSTQLDQIALPIEVATPIKPVINDPLIHQLGIDMMVDELTSGEETSSTSEAENGDGLKPAEQPKFCSKCFEADDGRFLTCQGQCLQMFHEKCVDNKKADDMFICEECESGKHSCFICKKVGEEEETKKCSDKHCGKFYHVNCLSKSYPVKFSNEAKDSFICPLHFCLHCHIETEGKKEFRPLKRRIVKCVMCPTAYHLGDYCIAAGTTTITQNCVICPEHYQSFTKKKKEKHLNVNWCFSCLAGGKLFCCEACPAAFHENCLDYVPDPAANFYCRDCNMRKQLHYGDIVWVKLGFYRWWPGRVTHPKSVPDNVMNIERCAGQFPVYFFGSHDYYWIHKGRCFLFAEGDNKAAANSGGGKSTKSLVQAFKNGMEEAVAAFEELQANRNMLRTAMLSNKPPAYIHIKSNKPVVQRAQPSKTDQHHCNRCDCDPNGDSPCSTEACLNRSLMTECDLKTCKAGDKCKNQQFKKREYIKSLKPFKTDKAGWGLRTFENISKGQFVIEYVGELLDEKECERRLKEMGEKSEGKFYFLTIDKDNIIDAGPKGNLARFMNHSCQPNCETQKWMVSGQTRVGLFAVCDIPAGSELTFNYNLDCRGNEKTPCHCGASNCSGFIGVRPIKSDDGNSKSNSIKKDKKKKQRKRVTKVHDDECFTCGEVGELIMCDRKGCTKSFHLSCLNIETIPEGKWECPCHECAIEACGKPAKLMCSCCHISLCKDHENDGTIKMTQLPDGGLLCSAHQMNEDVNGVLISPEVTSIGDDDMVEDDEDEEIELARSGHDDKTIQDKTPEESLILQYQQANLPSKILDDSLALSVNTSECLEGVMTSTQATGEDKE